MPITIDALIDQFDNYAQQAVTHAASSAEVKKIAKKIEKNIERILPKMKVTAVRLELQGFYDSLLWNVKRLLRESDSSGVISSIAANRRGVLRLKAPRSIRLQAELRATHCLPQE